MAECALCGKPVAPGGKPTKLHIGKKLQEIKTRTGSYEKTTIRYGEFSGHYFTTCARCNFKNSIAAVLTLPAAGFWVFTVVYAPINGIHFIVPVGLGELKFGIWTFLFGIVYLLVCMSVTLVIISSGFQWRSRRLRKKAFTSRGIPWSDRIFYKVFSENAYRELSRSQGGLRRQ